MTSGEKNADWRVAKSSSEFTLGGALGIKCVGIINEPAGVEQLCCTLLAAGKLRRSNKDACLRSRAGVLLSLSCSTLRASLPQVALLTSPWLAKGSPTRCKKQGTKQGHTRALTPEELRFSYFFGKLGSALISRIC